MAWRIGVDAGGTFTDVGLFDDSSGRLELWKVASTPGDPARGIAQGIEEAGVRAGLAEGVAAARLPLCSAVSDPAAGVAGAREMARLAGCGGLIGFDMGGGGTAVTRLDSGPAPDIHRIGIGGGTIAGVAADGRLRLAPGGPGPTVTDANLVLQTLNPEGLLGGRLRLEAAHARAAVGALAATLGLEPAPAAQAILSAAVAGVAAAIRAIPLPPGGTLVAYGGAGPLDQVLAVMPGVVERLRSLSPFWKSGEKTSFEPTYA